MNYPMLNNVIIKGAIIIKNNFLIFLKIPIL